MKNQQTDVHPTRVLFGTAYFSTTCITLYLGPMKSLWIYIERMMGLSLPFTECTIWCSPILLSLLQHCIWDLWRAFGHILKEWWASPFPLIFRILTGSINGILILHHSTSSFVQNLCDVALIFTLQLYFFTQNLQIYIVYIAILPHLREEWRDLSSECPCSRFLWYSFTIALSLKMVTCKEMWDWWYNKHFRSLMKNQFIIINE